MSSTVLHTLLVVANLWGTTWLNPGFSAFLSAHAVKPIDPNINYNPLPLQYWDSMFRATKTTWLNLGKGHGENKLLV